MSDHLIRVFSVYRDSCAASTRALYEDLIRCGPAGQLAVNLLRACKKSERAKVYRGMGARSFKHAAYDGKEWAISEICQILLAAPRLVARWGWGIDPNQPVHRHVLYVDLPAGQVSFHTGERGVGPDYPHAWDGRQLSSHRICAFAAGVLAGSIQ